MSCAHACPGGGPASAGGVELWLPKAAPNPQPNPVPPSPLLQHEDREAERLFDYSSLAPPLAPTPLALLTCAATRLAGAGAHRGLSALQGEGLTVCAAACRREGGPGEGGGGAGGRQRESTAAVNA